MGQIPRVRDDIRIHDHSDIYSGGRLRASALSHISISTLAGGSGIAFLANTQTFTGDNTFSGSTTFTGPVSIDSLAVVSSFTVPDSAFRISGSGDPTKLVAFEVDLVPVGTTTLTVQTSTGYTLAGLNLAQTFSFPQAIAPQTDTGTTLTLTADPTGLTRDIFEMLDDASNPLWTWDHDGLLTVNTIGGNNYGAIEVNAGAASYFVNSANNKTVFLELDGMTVGQSHQLSFINTGVRESFFPNAGGTILQNTDGAGLLPPAGALVYGAGTATGMSQLTIGAAGTVLTSTGAAPQWSTNAAVVDTARSWTTLQTFPDDKFIIVGSASANRTLNFEVDAASANADAHILWTGAADANFTLPPSDTTLAGLAIAQTFTAGQTITPTADVVSLTVNQSAAATGDTLSVFASSAAKHMSVDVDGFTNFFSVRMWEQGDVGSGFYIELAPPAGLTANRVFTFPDIASGTVAIANIAQTFSAKTINTSTIGVTTEANASTSSSGFAFQDVTTATKQLRMILSGAVGNNTFTFTNTAARNYGYGDLAGFVPVVGDDPPAVAAGALGKVDLTAQTADIAATNLTNAPPSGVYAIDASLVTSTGAAAGGTLALAIGWTDGAGAQARNIIAAHSLVTAQSSSGQTVVVRTSGEITYAVTVTGIYSTAAYAVYVRVTALG